MLVFKSLDHKSMVREHYRQGVTEIGHGQCTRALSQHHCASLETLIHSISSTRVLGGLLELESVRAYLGFSP